MAKPLAVLIVEDSESDAQLVVRLLGKAGYQVDYEQVETAERMRLALEKHAWDIVISDYSMPQFDGSAALTILQRIGLDIPFIVVSGTMGEDTAVAMMKAGAHDYLVKGKLARLVPAVERELEQAGVRRERRQIQEEMRANEKRFQALIENTTDGITLIDANRRAIYNSPAAIGMLGYGPEDWIGKDVFKLVHPDDLQKIQGLFHNLLETPGAHHADIMIRLQHKSGSWLWIEAAATNLLDEPGVNAIVLNYRDVTARKQAEEALHKSEADYRHLFDNANDVILIFQPEDEVILEANAAAFITYGFDHDELVGMSLKMLTKHPQKGEMHIKDMLEGRPQNNFESIHFNKDGEEIQFLINCSLIEYRGSKAILSINRNITERKKADEAIRLSEERFRTLYENNTLGLYRSTPDGRFLLANQSLVKMLGFNSFDELKNKNLEQDWYQPSYPRSQFIEMMERLGQVQGFENVWERRDGSKVYIRESARAIRDKEGRIQYYDGTIEDITERKYAEEALRESEARYKGLFEDSPIALWEEDFSAVKHRLDTLKKEGITDFQEYFSSHPEAIAECVALIKVLDVNKATLRMFGAKQKEDILRNLTEIFAGEPIQIFQDELVYIAEGRSRFEWVGANHTLDGRSINIELNWSMAPGYENSLSRVIVSMMDITERKKAESALAEERNLLRTLIDNLPDRIMAMDTQGRKTLSNLADWHASGGKTMEDVIGKTDLETYPHELAAGFWVTDRAVLDTGIPIINYEERGLDANRNLVWVLSTKIPLRDGHGKIIGLVSIGRDITERKQAEQRIQRQLGHLVALRSIDQVIISSFDLRTSLTVILNQVTKELGVDAADVLTLSSGYQSLDYNAGVGFRTRAAEKARLQLGQTHAGRVALERQLVQIPNLKEQPDDMALKFALAGEDFVCYYGVPLIAKGNVKGVLEVYNRTPLEPDREWLEFLNTLADQAALAIDNSSLFENLQRSNIDLTLAYDATIEGWSHALDLRDKETEGHSLRVTQMTMELAGLFRIKDEDLMGIRRGALLHDIGKMGVPDTILLKPAPLTADEWVMMKKHPALAFDMLSPIRYLRSAIDIPYCHHEKWDGTGYPRGLKGEQIPLSARIFAIADVWDALTSERPYRKAWSQGKAIEYLKTEAGKHFDPQIIQVCNDAGVFDRKKAKLSIG